MKFLYRFALLAFAAATTAQCPPVQYVTSHGQGCVAGQSTGQPLTLGAFAFRLFGSCYLSFPTFPGGSPSVDFLVVGMSPANPGVPLPALGPGCELFVTPFVFLTGRDHIIPSFYPFTVTLVAQGVVVNPATATILLTDAVEIVVN